MGQDWADIPQFPRLQARSYMTHRQVLLHTMPPRSSQHQRRSGSPTSPLHSSTRGAYCRPVDDGSLRNRESTRDVQESSSTAGGTVACPTPGPTSFLPGWPPSVDVRQTQDPAAITGRHGRPLGDMEEPLLRMGPHPQILHVGHGRYG